MQRIQSFRFISFECLLVALTSFCMCNSSNFHHRLCGAEDKRSYASYRAALKALPPDAPLVPHLGAHTAEMTMQDQQLPTEVPAPGPLGPDGKPAHTHIHFRRYRELFKLHNAMVDMQRRAAYPAGLLGPVVTSVSTLLASHMRPFYFFSEERREAAVANLDRHSAEVEPPPEVLEAQAAAAAKAKGKKGRK